MHPLGLMGLSQGLLLGNRQTMIRQPPSRLAWRLWAVIHSRTVWLTNLANISFTPVRNEADCPAHPA